MTACVRVSHGEHVVCGKLQLARQADGRSFPLLGPECLARLEMSSHGLHDASWVVCKSEQSRCAQDGDEGVALESCEFWSAFCEASVEPGVLQPFLGRLIPVLLKNMVYDEYDEEVSEAEAAERSCHEWPCAR